MEDCLDTPSFPDKIRVGSSRRLIEAGGNVMSKADLVEKVNAETGLTKRASREALDAITSIVSDALARGDKVTLVGFGTFQIMQRKARRGRNPQTGEEIQIPGKKVPKFKPGRALREKVK